MVRSKPNIFALDTRYLSTMAAKAHNVVYTVSSGEDQPDPELPTQKFFATKTLIKRGKANAIAIEGSHLIATLPLRARTTLLEEAKRRKCSPLKMMFILVRSTPYVLAK